MKPAGEIDELRLFERATQLNRWRWRAEEKRLLRGGRTDPFLRHLGQMQMLHTVWRELRREAGLPTRKPPHAVGRIARRLAEKKCRAYLKEHPDPDW